MPNNTEPTPEHSASAISAAGEAFEHRPNRTIVLLHGFAAHRRWMMSLEKYFRAHGHQTINWGYKSWFRPIEDHGNELAKTLRRLDEDEGIDVIDFVTHSMGCIVTRVALLENRPQKCGRWVMLAPPNRGSKMASRFNPLVGAWLKPVRQLRRSPDSFVNQLKVPENVDIAVVQAKLDYMVDADSTKVDAEIDRYLVPTLHSAMLFRKDVAIQSLHFLQHGAFQADS